MPKNYRQRITIEIDVETEKGEIQPEIDHMVHDLIDASSLDGRLTLRQSDITTAFNTSQLAREVIISLNFKVWTTDSKELIESSLDRLDYESKTVLSFERAISGFLQDEEASIEMISVTLEDKNESH